MSMPRRSTIWHSFTKPRGGPPRPSRCIVVAWSSGAGSSGRCTLTPRQSLHNLATVLTKLGRDDEAERLYKEALATWEQAVGPDHPSVAPGAQKPRRVRARAQALA